MSAHAWKQTTPERMAELVHQFAMLHGRCVVFIQGSMMVLRSATDARNSTDMDDEVGQFDARTPERVILTRVLGGIISELQGGN